MSCCGRCCPVEDAVVDAVVCVDPFGPMHHCWDPTNGLQCLNVACESKAGPYDEIVVAIDADCCCC